MTPFTDFLTTGAVGTVRVGATEAEVLAALGPPQVGSAREKPRVVKYGPLQLVYSRDGRDAPLRVCGLSVYPREAGTHPAPAFGPIPTSRTGLGDSLTAAGQLPPPADAEEFTLASGVLVVFDEDKVHGLYVRGPAEPQEQRKTKQVSLTLPVETLATLRSLAKRRNLASVQQLMVSVLENEANGSADE